MLATYMDLAEQCKIGQINNASLLLRKTLDKKPDEPEYMCAASMIARESGNYTAALAWADKAIKINSDFIQGYIEAAMCLDLMGEKEQALNLLSKSRIKHLPRHMPQLLIRAELLIDVGREEEAINEILEVDMQQIMSDVNLSGLVFYCANILNLPFTDELAWLNDWQLNVLPNIGIQIVDQVIKKIQQGQYAQALYLVRRGQRVIPGDADAIGALGIYYFHTQQYTLANKFLAESIFKSPKNFSGIAIHQFITQARIGHYNESIDLGASLHERGILSPMHLAFVAECLRRIDKTQESHHVASQVLDNPDAKFLAQTIIWRTNLQVQLSTEQINQLKQLAQNDDCCAAYLYYLADYFKTSDLSAAIYYAQIALKKDPALPYAIDWEYLITDATTNNIKNTDLDPLKNAGIFSPSLNEGCAWPTDTQLDLLKFCLIKTHTIPNDWFSKHPIDALDSGSARLLPFLFQTNVKDVTPRLDMHATLAGVWKKSFYENISQWRNALPVLDALQKAGIKITLIKGAALSIPLYGDWGSRPMSDIDILISKSSVKMASQIFKDHGWDSMYTYSTERVRFQYASTFKFPNGGNIDLHWRLGEDFISDYYSEEFETTEINLFDRSFSVLSAELNFLFTLTHGVAWDHTSPTRWVADAVLILRHWGKLINWDKVISLVKKYHLQTVFTEGLNFLTTHFEEIKAYLPSNLLPLEVPSSEDASILFGLRMQSKRHACTQKQVQAMYEYTLKRFCLGSTDLICIAGGSEPLITEQWCNNNNLVWVSELSQELLAEKIDLTKPLSIVVVDANHSCWLNFHITQIHT